MNVNVTSKPKPEFMKMIILFNNVNGILMIWASYILAYIGRTEIAETLSKTVVTEIVAVTTVYALKALFENLSKNNTWPDKTKDDIKKDME